MTLAPGFMQDYALTVDRFLDHGAKWHGGARIVTAGLEGDDDVAGYADIRDRANRLSGAFLDLGLKPGERVATLAWNTGHHLEVWYGAMGVGLVCHTLNPRLTVANLAAMIIQAEDRVLIVGAGLAAMARTLMDECPCLERLVLLDGDAGPGAVMLEELLAASGRPAVWGDFDERTPAGLCFTSGTTGAPKGVVLSQKNLVANARQVALHIDLKPEWVMFNPLPTFHSFGLTGGVILPLLQGMKAFEYPSPLHAKQITDLLPQVKASILFATDTFLNQYARVAEPDDFATLEFAVAGAEKVRDETRHIFNTKFGGVALLEGYGATEAAPVVAVNHPDRNRPGSVGQILPGIEYRIDEVPGITGGGRLYLRGPNVMEGYISPEDPEALDPLHEGWHDTGDIVDIDDEGYVTILGRVKRFAKIGGEMVSLTAVEGLASAVWPDNRHAVVAIADSRKGEKLVLVTDNKDASSSRLSEWARDHGAPELAVPKKIITVAEVPVLGTGKTDYVAIQKMVEAA